MSFLPPVSSLRPRPGRSRWRALVLVAAWSLGSFTAADAEARRAAEDGSTIGSIAVSALPREGRETLAAIRAGGPFASKRDGIAFGNREGILPDRARGYYTEYTVPTPGERTRGARRIIAGLGRTRDFRTSDEYYYTNDHYQSFRRIVQ